MRMNWLSHPLLLLACVLAGSVVGIVSPALAAALELPGQLASAVLEMAAMPLLVLATVFGLRNLMTLPQRGRRLARLLLLAALSLWIAGLLGTFTGALLRTGQALDDAERRAFGTLLQQTGGKAERTEIELLAPSAQPTAEEPLFALPANAYATLVKGDLPGSIWCTLVLALPFALMPRERGQALAALLEPVYRTLEQLVQHINKLLPLLAFGMAAHLGAQLSWEVLRLLGGLLGALLLSSAGVITLALLLVARQTGVGMLELLAAMKAPMLTALVAPTPVTSIPATISALTERLGLSRGIVELVVPVSTALLTAGSALQAGLITVFVSQLYELVPGPLLLIWIGTLSALAALLARADDTGGALAPAALVMLWLQLPSEAVLPVLLLIDGLSRSLRQLTSLACIAATCALLSGDLLSQRREWTPDPSTESRALQFTLTRGMAAAIVACVLGAGLLSALAGIGVGLRSTAPAQTSPAGGGR